MVSNFSFRSAPKIVFGAGVIDTLGQESSVLGTDKVLFVTDKNIMKTETFRKAIASLEKANIKPTVFADVLPEPYLDSLDAGLATLRNSGSRALIAMGGGSVIDTAKAFAALATNPGPLANYEGLDRFPNPALPLITIPTTAGTGSELSLFSVMNHREQNRKFVWGGASLVAKVALVDPAVLLKMPKAIAASTGMDAFTHALESYISKRASPLSELCAMGGLTLIAHNLPKFVADNENLEAAANQFIGSLEAIMGGNNSGLGVIHAMSHLVGARYHISHGVSCAVLMPYCLEAMEGSSVEKFAAIEAVLNPKAKYSSKGKQAKHLPQSIFKLLEELGIEPRFKGMGATKDDIKVMVEGIMKDPRQAHANSPRVLSNAEIAQVYESVLL